MFQHAATLRRRYLFAEVHAGFWKQEPFLTEVVSRLRLPRVYLVPLLVSEGYFSDKIIPAALGFGPDKLPGGSRIQQRGNQSLTYCAPVGTHDRMSTVVLARADEVARRFPFPRTPRPDETTLVVVGHGTAKDENSRKAVEHHVELIRSRNLYAAAHAVFLEESPRVPDCFSLAQTPCIIVVPFFIGEGPHVREDIPVLLGETKRMVTRRLAQGLPTWRNPTEKHGKLVWCSPPVGTDSLVEEVILERVREAAAGQITAAVSSDPKIELS